MPPIDASPAQPPVTIVAQASASKTAVNTASLRQPVVKAAIEALQRGDRAAWEALFEPGATFYDDGAPRNLANFHRDAIGHERFTGIERVSADGLEVVGPFHSDQWGSFKVYFRFTVTDKGRISRLDIGQAK